MSDREVCRCGGIGKCALHPDRPDFGEVGRRPGLTAAEAILKAAYGRELHSEIEHRTAVLRRLSPPTQPMTLRRRIRLATWRARHRLADVLEAWVWRLR